MTLTPLAATDVPGVAALWRYWFRDHVEGPAPDLEAHARSVLLDGPFADPEIPSWVARDDDGRLVGVAPVTTHAILVDGVPARAAAVFPPVVRDDGASTPWAALLLKRILSGAQDLTVSDGGHARFEPIWERLGGTVLPLESLHFVMPLRPAAALASTWWPKRLDVGARTPRTHAVLRTVTGWIDAPARALVPAIAPSRAPVDGTARRRRHLRATQRPPAVVDVEEVSPHAFATLARALPLALPRIRSQARSQARSRAPSRSGIGSRSDTASTVGGVDDALAGVHPAWDDERLARQVHHLERSKRLGTTHLLAVHQDATVGLIVGTTSTGGAARTFVFLPVLGHEATVLKAWAKIADAEGSTYVTGRFDRNVRRAAASLPAVAVARGSARMVHARDRSILDHVSHGRTTLTRLEGESWYWWSLPSDAAVRGWT